MSSSNDSLAKCSKLCSYAALLLFDEQLDITADNIMKLVKASNNTIPPFLSSLFVDALAGVDIKQILLSASTVSAAPVSAAPVAADVVEQTAAVEEAAEDDGDSSSDEMGDLGFSLFD
ncbi:ribosomal protein RPP1 [Cardiosporidium cionae]|uniref:Ribosomal protein RPP1 n=1 Tax=Cardiosporidium cionae TaxID=476202 RepID=A0ABQ7JAD8_9APIC|nr:ribosomal protein RPP1 [Cardiosporidium cionae]|eukprot:KAF8820961.1 ribosomal protein RPP1 [Cardiosporidium cionae]